MGQPARIRRENQSGAGLGITAPIPVDPPMDPVSFEIIEVPPIKIITGGRLTEDLLFGDLDLTEDNNKPLLTVVTSEHRPPQSLNRAAFLQPAKPITEPPKIELLTPVGAVELNERAGTQSITNPSKEQTRLAVAMMTWAFSFALIYVPGQLSWLSPKLLLGLRAVLLTVCGLSLARLMRPQQPLVFFKEKGAKRFIQAAAAVIAGLGAGALFALYMRGFSIFSGAFSAGQLFGAGLVFGPLIAIAQAASETIFFRAYFQAELTDCTVDSPNRLGPVLGAGLFGIHFLSYGALFGAFDPLEVGLLMFGAIALIGAPLSALFSRGLGLSFLMHASLYIAICLGLS